MIPIIYESSEISFVNNGLGRLPDCISCEVTEELNGIFECDFQYPITGRNYNLLQLGRIIAVTHDDTGDVQPFDIVSYSKPIDGVVSFHAVHISYRLTRYTAKVPNYPVDTNTKACTMFQNAYPQDGLWHYPLPQGIKSGTMAALADGTPKSVRQYIGGIEGSYLDTYGGEITWDKFRVIINSRRGTDRDFTIRYGVNMVDYNEEADGSETFAYAVPFWSNGNVQELVVGNRVDSGLPTYDDHKLTVPLDLSDKFEEPPTVSQLNDLALQTMRSGKTNQPKRTIEVDFVRLQDLDEFSGLANLLTCELGDSINVVFPNYAVSSSFRIVRVEWDVLQSRFKTMTLGSLQTTLAEALGGVGGGSSYSGGGGGGGDTVTVTPILTTGTEIAQIDVNGNTSSLFAPPASAATATRTAIDFHTVNKTFTPTESGVLVIIGRASAANASFSVYDNDVSAYAGIISISSANAYGTLTIFCLNGHTYKVQGATNWTSNGEVFYGFGGLIDGDNLNW